MESHRQESGMKLVVAAEVQSAQMEEMKVRAAQLVSYQCSVSPACLGYLPPRPKWNG